MQASVLTATLRGVEALPVEVQADVSAGLPVFGIVGLPDTAVQEARDRVRAALRVAGFTFPNARVIVNLAPAPLRKHGTGFDLPIALAVLCATGQTSPDVLRGMATVGELGLDATVRAVPGMLAHAMTALRTGRELLGPLATAEVAQAVRGLRYRGIESLSQLKRGLPPQTHAGHRPPTDRPLPLVDLADIAGHEAAKRVLQIAAAGGHNLLLVGPPGSGKTMLARALCGLLPPLTDDERLEAALVQSVAGHDPSVALAGIRPFRAPHHSSSIAGLVGGGTPTRPGEVSLAHHGVLFLDELPEFGPGALQALRQPIEDGWVTLVRVDGSVRYPARVTVVGAMNPCPCGYAGDSQRSCTCAPATIARYTARVGGPLFDRMDMAVRVDRIDPALLLDDAGRTAATTGAADAVIRARAFAEGRPEQPQTTSLRPAARRFLEDAARRSHLSGRGICRVLRVARTIADMEGSTLVSEAHVSEALTYRTWEPA